MNEEVKEFPADGAFGAARAAEEWLRARGFSFSPSQIGGPQAVFFGSCHVSKWRNLNSQEKASCHALLEAPRDGVAKVTLRRIWAPAEAVEAFFSLDKP